MDLPNWPDDALAQPTRAKLFRALDELRRPVGTAELAERFGLNANGVRVHLERLREAGLVARERTRRGRGRPRDMWSIAPDLRPGGDPPTAYADLGRWLASALTPGKGGLRAVEVAGQKIGRELAPPAGPGSPEEKMHAALGSLGFAPRREADDATLRYRLCNCPYRDVVSENQPVVCTLHRGMTRGLLDGLAPTTTLADFVPRDPYTAGCLIEVQGELADEGIARLDLEAAAEPSES